MEIRNRYLRLSQYPIVEKHNTPIVEKHKENNTYINNTINNTLDNTIVCIIEYLNKICGTNYRADSKKTISLIKARLKEKYILEDFKKVIFTMYNTWHGTQWEKYLRPTTLFSQDKFEGYLNQYRGGDIDGYSTTNHSSGLTESSGKNQDDVAIYAGRGIGEEEYDY